MPQDLDQRQAGLGSGERVLWFEPAVAVYGSEQSAVGGDSQARVQPWAQAV